MQLTRKTRIYPNDEQKEVLWQLSEINRRLYNYALTERQYSHANEIKGINYIKQQNDLPALKVENPILKMCNSKVLQLTLKTLDANYKSFFTLTKQDPNARPPRHKGKDYFTTMKFNQSGYKVTNTCVTLNHNMKNKTKLSFTIPEHEFQKVKQIEIFKDLKKDEWYLSVIEEVNPEIYPDNGLYQAWDLGISKQTAVNSQGRFFEVINIRPDKYWNPKIDSIQSRRDHCKKHSKKNKPSRRWNHYKSLQSRMMTKRGNQIKDFQHKVSKMIIENTRSNTIIIGDLDVKKMPQSKKTNRGLNRSTQGTGYLARFAGFLTYKGALAGKRVIEISERNTTKMCCKCGKFHYMPLSKRVMKCDCGNEIDRDCNSAVNIMVRYLSQNALWTSYQQFVDNLRNTGLDIPVHSQEAPCESVA